MSHYPAAVPQDLYESSTSQLLPLGTEFVFQKTTGPVWARYLSFGQTVSHLGGIVVNFAGAGGYNTDHIANIASTNIIPINSIAGIVCASLTTGGGYCWVAYRGAITQANFAASSASASVTVLCSANAVGRLITMISTYPFSVTTDMTNALIGVNGCVGYRRSSSTSYAATTPNTGAIFEVCWR